MGIVMAVVAVLAKEQLNTCLVLVMMVFLALFQWTMGTYAWVYLGQVACDEGLSLATMVLWLGVVILSIYTNKMFTALDSWGTFTFFAACCFLSFIFFFIFLKETKGLTRDECQVLYAKDKGQATGGK